MLNSLSIATSGYVCHLNDTATARCPDPVAIATHGYVCDEGAVALPPQRGGDSSKKGYLRNQIDTSLDGLMAREDDEIVAIIVATTRTLQ